MPSWRTVKARLPAVLAALQVLVGLLTTADVLPLLPPQWGPILLALGGALATLTRPVTGPHAARAGAQYRRHPEPPPAPEPPPVFHEELP